MKTYEQFLNEVMPHVPGCPTNVAVNAVRNSCIEFCEKSLVMQRDMDPVTVIEGLADYDLDPPTGYIVAKIMKAFYRNQPLEPMAPDLIDVVSPYNSLAPGAEGRSTPRGYFQKEERTFTLYPVPQETLSEALNLRVALKPTRTSTGVEDFLFEDYAEVIAYGAKGRLMSTPKTPYSDLRMAAVNKSLFDQGVNVARQRANRGNVRSNLSVRMRRL